MQISRNAFFSTITMVFILLAAFLLRIDTMYLWEISPQDYLVDNEPVLMNLDGYYYLNAAQEVMEQSYSPVETNRAFPDKLSRSPIPPLLSLILAHLSSLTNLSLNWIGSFLPTVLGLTIAVPLYLICLSFGGGHLMGIISCTFALLAPVYANRTSLGFLDTDCLNVTLALCCCYFFMKFSTIQSSNRYYHLGFGYVSYIIYLLWWDQAPSAVTVLSLSPLAFGLVFFVYKSPKILLLTIVITLFIVLSATYLLDKPGIFQLFEQAIGSLSYVSKQETGLYPNIGNTIAEQVPLNLMQLITTTTRYIPAFIISVFGLLWLFITLRRKSLFILPILVVGLFSVVFSMRFTIFIIPVIAIGIGFFFAGLYKIFPQKFIVPTIALCFTGFIFWETIDTGITKRPIRSGQRIAGMKAAKTLTPENSIIWSWWEEGHPLVYWSRRDTVNDGMVHDGQRTSYTSLPLQTDSFRLAANFMQFYAAHGKSGIQNFIDACRENNVDGLQLIKSILNAGPNELSHFKDKLPVSHNTDWPKFFFPNKVPPIYLFLDKDIALSVAFIFWYGSWNPSNLSGIPAAPMVYIDNIRITTDGKAESDYFTIDYANGEINIPSMFNTPIKLSKITTTVNNNSSGILFPDNYTNDISIPPYQIYTERKGLFEKMVTNEGRLEFDVSEMGNYAVLQDEKFANSVLNRLFWRIDDYDTTYFEPIILNTPHYQIWKVSGDKNNN